MSCSLRFRRFPDRVSVEEWTVLSRAMDKEPTILKTRITPKDLAGVYERGLALVLERDGEMIGFIAAWPVSEKFAELGSAWIRRDFRGQKLGDMLYEQSRLLPCVGEKIVFAVTQNPVALRAGRRAGLEPHTNWTNPIPWCFTCGPCDKWKKDEEKHACPFRDRTCWLRVVRRTSF